MAVKNILALLFFLSVLGVSVSLPLTLDYYKPKCPNVKSIVRRVTAQYVTHRPSLAAALLRMHFHDCFVRGCDASVLLKSPKNDTERYAFPNLTSRGYEVIDAAKRALEKKCPGVVSCADVLALVVSCAVEVIGGPRWPVPLGRRDGRISIYTEAFTLPSRSANITTLKKNFADRGLNAKDLVVLSGAHTIGLSTCRTIQSRIHNFTGKGDVDPTMNTSYVRALQRRCKPSDTTTPVEMDPGSYKRFDSHYFNAVAQKKGLFTSDAVLLDDFETNLFVQTQVHTGGFSFFRDFSDSMVKLGAVGVLTGKQGEIRRRCAYVN